MIWKLECQKCQLCAKVTLTPPIYTATCGYDDQPGWCFCCRTHGRQLGFCGAGDLNLERTRRPPGDHSVRSPGSCAVR